MKNAIIVVLLGLLAGYIAVCIGGCATMNDLTEDIRDRYDSVSQVITGRPNEGGKYSREDALDAAVKGAMIKKIMKTDEGEQDIEDAKKVSSIMRISGSLYGVIANPHHSLSLTINVFQKDGAVEKHVLLPRHLKEIFFPPGIYDVQYIQKNKEWWSENYEITNLKAASYTIARGWRVERLKLGSMTEYDQIQKIDQDQSIQIRFGFIGPD